MTYISWFSDIGLYLDDYFMYKAVTLAGGIREPLLTCSSFGNAINFNGFDSRGDGHLVTLAKGHLS